MMVQFDVLAHIQGLGDVSAKAGQFVGTRGETRRLEGFAITLEPWTRGLGLRYQASIRGTGETNWVENGTFVGTRGQSRPLEGFRIELSGEAMPGYDVLYMAHISGKGDTEWLANGDYCGASEPGHQIEGLAIRIEPRKPDDIMLISKATSGSGKSLAITAPASPRSMAVLVSAPDGSDLQVWDRRPVRGGIGYALINRARPYMCIARGQGQEAVLRHTVEIDTDDRCVWLDDTVPGQWNAIRSRTDLELKLNMRGDPPYADEGNVLIVYPWARAAQNELWQQKKITYDLIGGTDAVALDDILRAIHAKCYPDLFKGVLRFESSDIKAIGFDLTNAPTVRVPFPDVPFDPSDPSSPVALRVMIDDFELSVEGVGGSWTTRASVEMLARITFFASGPWRPDTVGLELRQGRIHVEQHPEAEGRLNELLVPWLIEHLNLQIFLPLAIPIVEPVGIKFTAPAVAAQHPHLIAAFSKAPDTAISPRPTPWPLGKAFTGLGTGTLNAVLSDLLSRTRVYGDWVYAEPLRSFRLDANFQVLYRNPQVTILPLSGDKCRIRIDLHGDCYLFIRSDFTPRASGTGYVNFTSRLVVNHDKAISVVLESLDEVVLDWRTDKPSMVDDVYPKLFPTFSEVTSRLVVEDLRGKSFPICTFPTVEASIAGRAFEITLSGLEVSSFVDAEYRGLALVTGTPSIRVK
jgi:hypothetical protein